MCRTQLTTHCVLLRLFRPGPITHPAQIKPHEHLPLPTPTSGSFGRLSPPAFFIPALMGGQFMTHRSFLENSQAVWAPRGFGPGASFANNQEQGAHGRSDGGSGES